MVCSQFPRDVQPVSGGDRRRVRARPPGVELGDHTERIVSEGSQEGMTEERDHRRINLIEVVVIAVLAGRVVLVGRVVF